MACPLFLGLTWDSGTFLFLLVNAVKLLNEKYFIFSLLQQQRCRSEQPWGLCSCSLEAAAGVGLEPRSSCPGAGGCRDGGSGPAGQQAELTHVCNLLLQQADDPPLAFHHLDVAVGHGSATTGTMGMVAPTHPWGWDAVSLAWARRDTPAARAMAVTGDPQSAGFSLGFSPYSQQHPGHEEEEEGVLHQVLLDPGQPGDVGAGLLHQLCPDVHGLVDGFQPLEGATGF